MPEQPQDTYGLAIYNAAVKNKDKINSQGPAKAEEIWSSVWESSIATQPGFSTRAPQKYRQLFVDRMMGRPQKIQQQPATQEQSGVPSPAKMLESVGRGIKGVAGGISSQVEAGVAGGIGRVAGLTGDRALQARGEHVEDIAKKQSQFAAKYPTIAGTSRFIGETLPSAGMSYVAPEFGAGRIGGFATKAVRSLAEAIPFSEKPSDIPKTGALFLGGSLLLGKAGQLLKRVPQYRAIPQADGTVKTEVSKVTNEVINLTEDDIRTAAHKLGEEGKMPSDPQAAMEATKRRAVEDSKPESAPVAEERPQVIEKKEPEEAKIEATIAEQDKRIAELQEYIAKTRKEIELAKEPKAKAKEAVAKQAIAKEVKVEIKPEEAKVLQDHHGETIKTASEIRSEIRAKNVELKKQGKPTIGSGITNKVVVKLEELPELKGLTAKDREVEADVVDWLSNRAFHSPSFARQAVEKYLQELQGAPDIAARRAITKQIKFTTNPSIEPVVGSYSPAIARLFSGSPEEQRQLKQNAAAALIFVKSRWPKLLNQADSIYFSDLLGPSTFSPAKKLVTIDPITPIRGKSGSVQSMVYSLVHELEHAREFNRLSRRLGLVPGSPESVQAFMKGYVRSVATAVGIEGEPTAEERAIMKELYEEQSVERGPVKAGETAVIRYIKSLPKSEQEDAIKSLSVLISFGLGMESLRGSRTTNNSTSR